MDSSTPLALASVSHVSARQGARTAAVVFAGFCAFLTLFAPQPMLPMLAAAFRVSAGTASLVVSASTIAVAAAAPFAGIIADRFGRKRVIVPAAFLLAVPTLLAATSTSLGQLLFWRFWQGVFTPGIFAVTVAYINDEWQEGTGAAMSAYVSGTVVGGFTGRMLAALATAHFSWQWAFVALGVLNALGAVAIWIWLPPDRQARRTGKRPRPNSPPAVLAHLRNPRLLATYAVGFCVLFTQLATFTYINFYLMAPPFHLSTTALGLLFVVFLVGAFVTPFAGRLIDTLGNHITLALALSTGVAGISLTLVHQLPAVIAGLALCCTGAFVSQSSASSYIGTAANEARAAAVGLYVTSYYLGGSFGSAIPGRFWSHGGWPACVALIAAVQVVTISMALVFWKPEPTFRRGASPNLPAQLQ